MKKNDCDIILIFGASAVVDRADILPSAVTEVGGKVEHFGMPVDPGNLLFIGNVEEISIIGMPGCARSPKLNGFDWVLWRLLANVPVTGRDIMLMGNGGLLKEINERGQLRQFDNSKVTEAKEPKIGGLLLAAGSSRRMGKENKLLQEINGTKMVVHDAEQIGNSKISELACLHFRSLSMARPMSRSSTACTNSDLNVRPDVFSTQGNWPYRVAQLE